MCGLLGFISMSVDSDHISEHAQKLLSDRVYTAGELMYHRGPDDPGTWNDNLPSGQIIFAFNRLAFIDIEHSHQPLLWGPKNDPNRYVLVFNGEIYNYLELREELSSLGAQFSTLGDGEAIIAGWHYWGVDILKKLRGMFAFAIWDRHEGLLFLARDPFGIKPLYLAATDKGTIFSSEKKCILALTDELNIATDIAARTIQQYLYFQYVPEPHTLNIGITRLESGSYALIKPGEKPEISRYFFPVFAPKKHNNALYHEIADALRDSVAVHMRSDVTVGSFLSGGIDSTAIAALAKEINPNLLTFTTGFRREGYSEVDVAAQSAQAIGSKHIVTIVEQEEYLAAIPEIIWYLDEPVADPSLVPLYFLAKKAREHVKVVLSGEGADELFGGYTIYKEPLSLRPFNLLPHTIRRLAGAISTIFPEGIKGKSLLHRGSLTLEQRYYGNSRSFSDAQLQRIFIPYRKQWDHQDITAEIYARSRNFDPVARMQNTDFFTWLRGDILVKADKMTMANSLELRVPFMDPHVWNIASTLSIKDKISHNTTKYALRKALELIVPPHVLLRPKLGFPVPIRYWLQEEPMYTWAKDIIAVSQVQEYFRYDELYAMLEEHRTGISDHSRRLWTVLIFMIWHQIFIAKTLEPKIEKKVYPVRL